MKKVLFGLAVFFCLLAACAQEKAPAVSDADREAKRQKAEARMANKAAEAERVTEQRRAEELAAWAKQNPKAAKLLTQHPNWGRDICQTISNRKIQIGFTAEQVRAAWGNPTRVAKVTQATGSGEAWMYESDTVYFVNDVAVRVDQVK